MQGNQGNRIETEINATTPELVKRFQSGDKEAFGTLYENLYPRIYKFISCRVSTDPAVVEDLTAEVLKKLLGGYKLIKIGGYPLLLGSTKLQEIMLLITAEDYLELILFQQIQFLLHWNPNQNIMHFLSDVPG